MGRRNFRTDRDLDRRLRDFEKAQNLTPSEAARILLNIGLEHVTTIEDAILKAAIQEGINRGLAISSRATQESLRAIKDE